jgi:hypothetical protein
MARVDRANYVGSIGYLAPGMGPLGRDCHNVSAWRFFEISYRVNDCLPTLDTLQLYTGKIIIRFL